MPRRAFTLVELLVVIAIMITLMALIMGGVMLAKRSAQRAKAVSLLGAVASAIDQYRSLNNTYPERVLYQSAVSGMPTLPSTISVGDGEEVYAKVFSGAATADAVGADAWRAVNLMLVYQLGDLIRDQAPKGVLLDPWGQPLRYRPAKWYPYAAGASDRIDGENPPGQDTFQLWSLGPDAKQADDAGEGGDDIPNWAKLP